MEASGAGLRWMAAGAFFFSAMSALVKLGGAAFPTMQLVWVRSVVVLVLALGTLLLRGRSPWGRERRLLLLRGLLGFGGLTSFYYAVVHLPLAEATVIQYTNPVWTALIAAAVLGEWIGWRQVGLALMALGGVVLVARPTALFGAGVETLDPAVVAIAFVGALFSAAAYVTVRRLRGEDTLVVVFWFALLSTLLALPAAALGGWRIPVGGEWLLLLGIGLTTHLGQVFLTMGLKREAAGRVMTVGYLQIVFAAVWGIWLFGDVPEPLAILGGALVIASVVGVARSAPPPVVPVPTPPDGAS